MSQEKTPDYIHVERGITNMGEGGYQAHYARLAEDIRRIYHDSAPPAHASHVIDQDCMNSAILFREVQGTTRALWIPSVDFVMEGNDEDAGVYMVIPRAAIERAETAFMNAAQRADNPRTCNIRTLFRLASRKMLTEEARMARDEYEAWWTNTMACHGAVRVGVTAQTLLERITDLLHQPHLAGIEFYIRSWGDDTEASDNPFDQDAEIADIPFPRIAPFFEKTEDDDPELPTITLPPGLSRDDALYIVADAVFRDPDFGRLMEEMARNMEPHIRSPIEGASFTPLEDPLQPGW